MGNKIISNLRRCQGLTAFVKDGHCFFSISAFSPSRCSHTHTHTLHIGPAALVISSPWLGLCADVSKNPILLLHCASGDRGPSLRAQGHRTRRHKEPYLLLCPHVQVCAPALSTYHPCLSLSVTHPHAHTDTHAEDPCCSGSGSLLFIRSASREQAAP